MLQFLLKISASKPANIIQIKHLHLYEAQTFLGTHPSLFFSCY